MARLVSLDRRERCAATGDSRRQDGATVVQHEIIADGERLRQQAPVGLDADAGCVLEQRTPSRAMLKELEGERLSSVELVQDYVQLRFDGLTLTADTARVILIADCDNQTRPDPPA
jgi:hypothetical protein